MFEHIPEEIKQTVIGIVGLLPTAVLGSAVSFGHGIC